LVPLLLLFLGLMIPLPINQGLFHYFHTSVQLQEPPVERFLNKKMMILIHLKFQIYLDNNLNCILELIQSQSPFKLKQRNQVLGPDQIKFIPISHHSFILIPTKHQIRLPYKAIPIPLSKLRKNGKCISKAQNA
jgi:hypothetical protein